MNVVLVALGLIEIIWAASNQNTLFAAKSSG